MRKAQKRRGIMNELYSIGVNGTKRGRSVVLFLLAKIWRK